MVISAKKLMIFVIQLFDYGKKTFNFNSEEIYPDIFISKTFLNF